jgi:poly(3-hydroxybutyrate) depolymerase
VSYHFPVRYLLVLLALPLLAQQPQNPSPMVEHTRAHPRTVESTPAGRRLKLELGTLFIPARLEHRRELPLLVHFHGGTWLPEVAAARYGRAAVITAQLGSGSATYAKPFQDQIGRASCRERV